MNCKIPTCHKPIEQSIEGECICVDCWTLGQMSAEEIKMMKEREWFDKYCAGCEKPFKTRQEKQAGFCKSCQKENEEAQAIL